MRTVLRTGLVVSLFLVSACDCNNPGTWAFHCHILAHAESDHGMFGMVTALVVT